ncbi:MAG: T9SS type A sorting domain-containing protein [Bacteroidota bacterium]
MKKINLLTLLLMTIALVSNAQIINGDFELWTDSTIGAYTYDSLVSWKTTDLSSLQNSNPHVHSAQPETTDVQSGSSSIKLTSWTAGGFFTGIPGAASNGDVLVNIAAFTITPVGGVTDAVPHGALMGYYEYTPGTGDHGSIEACLYKRNGASRDTIAYGALDAALLIGTYTHFVINLTPVGVGTPDSSLIWLQSSPRSPLGSGKTGSILRVDSLYYSGMIGIDEMSPLIKSMLTFPVPAVNEINVHVELVAPVTMNYEIMDITGKIVLTDKMNSNKQQINVSQLANGNYSITLLDDAGKKLCADKFMVAR